MLAGLVSAFALVGFAGHTLARLEGWLTVRVAPDALSAMLSPHYRIARPDGAGPFPTALLFHGCDGVQRNMTRWSDALVDAGWATVIVDSYTPRALDGGEAWRLVCAGQQLPGGERAGDVLTAIADATAMPFVDRERLALIGMSHGGWSIMELLALDSVGRAPLNLQNAPPALAETGLSGVSHVVLVYPWCGLPNRGRRDGWTHEADVLFILAGEDIIAPASDCLDAVDRLAGRVPAVETLVIDGATHAFDDEHPSMLSPLSFDEAATREALTSARAFLATARRDHAEGRPLSGGRETFAVR